MKGKNVKTSTLVAAGIAVAIVLSLISWLTSREPVYQGRSISEWFEFAKLYPADWSVYGPAFRHFRTDGQDFLVWRLTATRSSWVNQFYERVNLVAQTLGRKPPIQTAYPPDERPYVRRLLGYYGREAADRLLLELKRAPVESQVNIIQALGELGPEAGDLAGPALVLELTNSSDEIVSETVTALGAIQYKPAEIAPRLLPLLTNGSSNIRVEATYTLSSYPGLTVPAITLLSQSLDDPNPVVQANAACALGRIGSNAAPAIVPLEALLGRSTLPASRAVQAITAITGGLPDDLRGRLETVIQSTLRGDDDYYKLMVLPAANLINAAPTNLPEIYTKLLSTPKNWQVWEAVDALSELDPRPPWADELLRKVAAEHPNGLARVKAEAALRKK